MAFETIHSLKGRSQRQNYACGFKIDIAKAYDRVNWEYICDMLSILGFDPIWQQWMKMCFMDVGYYVCVNDTQMGLITSSRDF